jgi:hypothetical protein
MPWVILTFGSIFDTTARLSNSANRSGATIDSPHMTVMNRDFVD